MKLVDMVDDMVQVMMPTLDDMEMHTGMMPMEGMDDITRVIFMRNLLFIPIFLSVFLASCENEYLDHIHREHTPIISSSGNSDALSGEIFVLPDTRVLEGLVTDIDNAKSRVWLETYTWTEKSTQEAILRAKER